MKNIILGILIIVFLTLVFFLYQFFSAANPRDTALKDFVIKKGETVYTVSKKLQDEGFIRDNFYFRLYVWPRRYQNKEIVRVGTYKLSPSMRLSDIVGIIMGTKISLEDNFTVPEGWRMSQVADIFAEFKVKYSENPEDKKDALKKYKKEFVDAAQDSSLFKYDSLSDRPDDLGLEGYLFPDTYRVYRNVSAKDLIQKMLKNFDKKLGSDLRKEIKRQNKTIFETITLASIVQKEVTGEEDMKKVAGVYLNRLKIGKNLESDVTITYITEKKDPQPTTKDTRLDSPYNTYLYSGLPKGPVSNPGLTAIVAAIYPAKHDYLYFITRLDTGEAIFSKDPDEHMENSEKYLPK